MTISTKDFRDTFNESLLALIFDVGGIAAGFLLYIYLERTEELVPYSMLLYPGILSMRGVINGIFSGNLTTKLHLGTIKPSFKKVSRDLKVLYALVFTLTLVGGLTTTLICSLIGIVSGIIELSEVIGATVVVMATMDISLILISPVTAAIAFYSFKSGLDPDKIVYPVMSTIADIVATLCYVYTLSNIYLASSATLLLQLLVVFFTLLQVSIIYSYLGERSYVKQMKECILTVVIVSFLAGFSGFFLDRLTRVIERENGVYTVYPAIIDTVGDVGSIVGSVATTRLFIGRVQPSFSLILRNLGVVSGAWSASLVLFIVYFLVAVNVSSNLSVYGYLRMARIILATNLFSIASIVGIALVSSIVTYRRGLNPDNFVNPIVSTVADTVATLTLYLAVTLL